MHKARTYMLVGSLWVPAPVMFESLHPAPVMFESLHPEYPAPAMFESLLPVSD